MNKTNYRLHGKKPYSIVAVHGGPGAPGSVYTLAKLLSIKSNIGVIEPFQTESTISGLIEELKSTIVKNCPEKVYLFGHSWGAWLVYLFAHKHPQLVKKIFLIGSGCFDEKYLQSMNERRFAALLAEEKIEYDEIVEKLKKNESENDKLLARLGELAEKADNFHIENTRDNIEKIIQIDGNAYRKIWNEASNLRKQSHFIEIASEIKTPVRIIHGAEDPTPAEGVVKPLENHVLDLRFYKIDKAGHSPWKEKYGYESFLQIIDHELYND